VVPLRTGRAAGLQPGDSTDVRISGSDGHDLFGRGSQALHLPDRPPTRPRDTACPCLGGMS